MSVSDKIQLLTIVLPAVGGTIYWAVRLAIRAEVQAMELRIGEKYVSKDTCHANRQNCAKIRAAEAGNAR